MRSSARPSRISWRLSRGALENQVVAANPIASVMPSRGPTISRSHGRVATVVAGSRLYTGGGRFFRKVFSADYRAAVAAEAAGNVDLAAERYALAGEHAGAVRMHLARAARAPTRQAELGALRDAMRWAGDAPAL